MTLRCREDQLATAFRLLTSTAMNLSVRRQDHIRMNGRSTRALPNHDQSASGPQVRYNFAPIGLVRAKAWSITSKILLYRKKHYKAVPKA